MKKLIVFLFRIKKTELHYETIVNPKPRKGLQRIFKISVIVGLLLMANISHAQISFDMGAGYNIGANTCFSLSHAAKGLPPSLVL